MGRRPSILNDDHFVVERLVHGVQSLDEVEDVAVEMDESFADRDRLNGALMSLSPRLERAIRLRYGFCGAGGDGPMTFAEIGQLLGVTNTRATQMVAQAQRKMFRFLHASRRVTPEEQDDLNKQRAIYEAEERVLRERQAHWQEARAAQERAERDRRAAEIEQAMEAQCRRNAEALAADEEREARLLPVTGGFAGLNRSTVRPDHTPDVIRNERALLASMRSILVKINEIIDRRYPLLMLWVPFVAGLMLVLKPAVVGPFLITFLVFVWLPWELTVFQRFGMDDRSV
jgi:hypothetical protein